MKLKPGHYPVKQKARSIPLHIQEDTETENLKINKSRTFPKT